MSPDPIAIRIPTEAQLVKALKSTSVSSANLKELVSLAHRYQKLAGGPLQIFPKGIPVPDSIEATFALRPKSLGPLLDRVLADGRVVNIHVFPLGIPVPDLLQTRLELR